MSRRICRPKFALSRESGFTLVELLVVVSVIALLISILLPSLKKARDQAKMVKCAANQRQVGQAVAGYLLENQSIYPPSYVYPTDEKDSWHLRDGGQDTDSSPNGYLHWSHFLYAGGQVKDEAFECPNFPNGGAPRTNPGPVQADWESGQRDADGQTVPNQLVDKQARRMAFTANAAIMPRNKFTTTLSGGNRVNKLIQEGRIRRSADTILATEFLRDFRALGVTEQGRLLIKSHRPVNVFYHLGTGSNEYESPDSSPGFIYGKVGLPTTPDDYGLWRLRDLKGKSDVINHESDIAQINAVGRSHPGGDAEYGGTANFLFVDSHVERMTPLSTLEMRKWGDRYWTLSGENEVLNARPR